MAKPFTFVCLDPHKSKRAKISALLGPLGKVRWLQLPMMGLHDWPQTQDRAETALLAGRGIPKPGLARTIWKRILRMQYNGTRAYFEKNPTHVAVGWNGLNGSRRVFMDAAKDAGAKTLFFELSPFPGRITVDPVGVNNANGLPRDPQPYQAWLAASGHDPSGWRDLGAAIKQRTPDHPPAPTANLPSLQDPFIFAPLQVPGDSQLRLFGGEFRTVDAFVKALIYAAAALPEGWHLRLKEHPSTRPFVAAMLRGVKAPIYLDNTTDTFAQVAASRGVVTINSSVGLEAMFFDKPVTACGDCFWTIPGMADRAPDQNALTAAMANAASWQFDAHVRDAVLSFLDQVYYPQASETMDSQAAHEASQQVAQRLSGPDEFGFWAHPNQAKS